MNDDQIQTEYWPKPIPMRNFDWEAWYDNMDEETRYTGHGRTEAAAIEDLKEHYNED